MSKTIEEIIEDYTKKRISGVTDFNKMIDKSLFQPIEHVKNIAERYATVKTQELQEQNAELVEMLEKFKEEIIKAYNQGKQDFARYDPERHGNDLPDGESYYRTKHNHLNKKP